MKKVILLTSFIVIFITTGMVLGATAQNKKTKVYESNTPISEQEKAKIDEKRKEDRAKQYSIYVKFGLKYDNKEDSFIYKDNKVRFFTDTLDDYGHLNSFVRCDGIVDVKAIRNEQYVLTGLEFASKEEYDQRTTIIEAAKKKVTGIVQKNSATINDSTNVIGSATEGDEGKNTSGISNAEELPNPEYIDNTLNEYRDFGISYNNDTKQWFYQGKPIHFFTDGDIKTYLDDSQDSIKNGILLKVKRKNNGEIDKLVQISTIK